MPILFSAVVYDKVVLDQFATCEGNFSEIVELVVRKIPERSSKMTYSFGRYLLHYIDEDGRFYVCITDRTCQRSRAFLFLNEVRRQFQRNESEMLAKQMYRYNEEYGTVVIGSGELEQVNSIGVESSESLLGESIVVVGDDHDLRYATTRDSEASPQNASVSSEGRPTYDAVAAIVVGLSLLFALPSRWPYSSAVIFLLIAIKVFGTM